MKLKRELSLLRRQEVKHFELDFAGFVAELKKQKIKLSLSQQDTQQGEGEQIKQFIAVRGTFLPLPFRFFSSAFLANRSRRGLLRFAQAQAVRVISVRILFEHG